MNRALRDVFWDVIYEKANTNHDIMIVSADLGAMSLDKFRKNLPSQFVNVGIAEQNAIMIAAGLALGGKKVYVYGNSPFIYLRCYEIIRQTISMENIPVTIVGQGAGFSFAKYGSTHYGIEDIGAMRMLPNIKTYCLSDPRVTELIAEESLVSQKPMYVRMDKLSPDEIHHKLTNECIIRGYEEITCGDDCLIIATGNTVEIALVAQEELQKENINCGIVDMFCMQPNAHSLIETIGKYKHVISIEEHTLSCGMGSILCELICDNGLDITIKRIAVNNKFGYGEIHGNRLDIQLYYGITSETIVRHIKELGKHE